MRLVIIDTSVAAKWFFNEENSPKALSLLDSKNQLHAPDFLFLEMASLLYKWVRHDLISEKEGREIQETLKNFPIQKHSFSPLIESAFTLANKTQTHPYDALYLATALLLKGEMVTADKRFYNQIEKTSFKKNILCLGDELDFR